MLRKRIALLLATTTAIFGFASLGAPVYAAPGPSPTPLVADNFNADACSGIGALGGTKCGSGGNSTVNKLFKTAIQLLSLVVGFAAVIVVIISGFRFVTSGGDPANVAKARNGLLYAAVGLVITAVSQVIVHFVLGKVK